MTNMRIFRAKPENFSFNIIEENLLLIVPLNQQMIVHGTLAVQGDLIVKGEVVIEE